MNKLTLEIPNISFNFNIVEEIDSLYDFDIINLCSDTGYGYFIVNNFRDDFIEIATLITLTLTDINFVLYDSNNTKHNKVRYTNPNPTNIPKTFNTKTPVNVMSKTNFTVFISMFRKYVEYVLDTNDSISLHYTYCLNLFDIGDHKFSDCPINNEFDDKLKVHLKYLMERDDFEYWRLAATDEQLIYLIDNHEDGASMTSTFGCIDNNFSDFDIVDTPTNRISVHLNEIEDMDFDIDMYNRFGWVSYDIAKEERLNRKIPTMDEIRAALGKQAK